MNQSKRILLFGSGMVTKSVLLYFNKYPNFALTIVSSDKVGLKSLEDNIKGNFSYVFADVHDKTNCQDLVGKHDLVISLLPAPLHPLVAQFCLDTGKHLVTASYLSAEMQPFAEKAKQKGLSFLFELGLDPGIDHIVTLKIIDDIRKKNGIVKKMHSFCGGLVSPDCVDNPLGYKFSWSPMGVFRALSNDAIYMENGVEIKVKAAELLYTAREFTVNNALNLVYYPNRDSLKYRKLYNIMEAKTVLRGTFRYKGFCEIIAAFQELGLLKETKTESSSWQTYINNFVNKARLNKSMLSNMEVKYIQEKFPGIDYSKIKFVKILGAITSNKIWKTFTKDTILAKIYLIMDGLDFFGFLTCDFKLNSEKTVLENFIDTLTPFLTMKPADTDSIIMTIKFDVEYPKTFISEEIIFQMVMNGEKNGMTAMARTVGTPSAIGAKLILDGTIAQRGLFGPFTADVYTPIYEEMVKEGLISNYKKREFKPKL